MILTQKQIDDLKQVRNNKAQDYLDAGCKESIYQAFQFGFDACLWEIQRMNEPVVCDYSGVEIKSQSVCWDLQTK